MKEENQNVVAAFLNKNTAFILEKTGQFLPLNKSEDDMIQLLPQIDATDGFFIARMKREV